MTFNCQIFIFLVFNKNLPHVHQASHHRTQLQPVKVDHFAPNYSLCQQLWMSDIYSTDDISLFYKALSQCIVTLNFVSIVFRVVDCLIVHTPWSRDTYLASIGKAIPYPLTTVIKILP